MNKKPRLGSGKRFDALVKELEEQGVDDPEALAAHIGRKKYGERRYRNMAERGHRSRLSPKRFRLPK